MGRVKRLAKWGTLGAFALAGGLRRTSGHPIIYYHSVSTEAEVVSLPPGCFRQEIVWFRSRGLEAVSMRPFLNGVLQTKQPSGRQLFLTFDDGLEGFYHHVFPILEELGASATVFLVTGHVGGRADWYPKESGGVVPPMPMLNWAQIREMHQRGIDFQAHTHTHPHLTEIPLKDAVEEALRSKKTIEDGIGSEVSLFCYPNGKFSSEIASAIQDCGFQAAVTTEPGMYRSGDDPFSIKRLGHDLVRVDDRVTARLVSRMLLNGTFPSYVAFKRNLRRRRWISSPFELSDRETSST